MSTVKKWKETLMGELASVLHAFKNIVWSIQSRITPVPTIHWYWICYKQSTDIAFTCKHSEVVNRPFAGSGHMVRNKLHWDANDAVRLSKQRIVGLDWYEFLRFGSPTALFVSQCNLFHTMWPDPAKGLFSTTRSIRAWTHIVFGKAFS